jgi:hypothetical protein
MISNDVDAASVVAAAPPLTLMQSLIQGYANTQPHTGRLSEPRLGLASAAAGQTLLFAGGEGRGKRLSATVDLYVGLCSIPLGRYHFWLVCVTRSSANA